MKIKHWFQSKKNHDAASDTPHFPIELFSDEQMEKFGSSLAESHSLSARHYPSVLLHRLSECEKILIKTFNVLTDGSAFNNYISPAGEWFLDNFYLIEEQIFIIKNHIPKNYEKGLPQLNNDFVRKSYPRIYDIILQLTEHSDGHWDIDKLSRFIQSYQSVTPLSLGELWAIPAMLRFALIENICQVSVRITSNRNGHNLADYWVDQMIEVAATDPKRLVLIIADMVRSDPPMISAFVAEFTRRLQSAELVLPLKWIEQKIAEDGLTIEELIQAENTQQAADQVTISNIIASLRRINEVDWHEFVEAMSVVEHTLREDPAEVYAHMDFNTRDSYRHVVEYLARYSDHSEAIVATAAIQLAREQADTPRKNHVGYYLIDAGLPKLKKILELKISPWKKIYAWIFNYPLACYLLTIGLAVAAITFYLIQNASEHGLNSIYLFVLSIVTALCLSELALALINLILVVFIKPKLLPKMDFSHHIPAHCRTLVVIPSLIANENDVDTLTEALEIRYLGNRDKHLHFALLTDFNDALLEHKDEDDILLALARKNIESLNKKYASEEDIFFLFHRPRTWNMKEEKWMGHERKRGKLNDLNALLRVNDRSDFSLIVGRLEILSTVKYVITLDSDTQLPRESAHKLIGAMAHPLNNPQYNLDQQCVKVGYGILQPRIAEALSNKISPYVRLYNNEMGIDPYTRAVSNIYQDLFQEGSFIGKGIYDVDVFQKIIGHHFPDNLILSHDLLEGCYLRSGYLSDVILYENSPVDYLSDVKRRVRWIRGDWQLIGWLMPIIKNHEGRRIRNPLTALSKWKLFDNLRRSLIAPSLLTLLVLAFTVLPAPQFWCKFIITLLLLPIFIGMLLELLQKSKEILLSQHLITIMQHVQQRMLQLIFYLVCLPYETGFTIKAIAITCWRILVSHNHLLEWTASNQLETQFQSSLMKWIVQMWIGPVFAFAFLLFFYYYHRTLSLLLALPLLILWILSPLIARWLSRPFQTAEVKLDKDQKMFLRMMARRTWEYFNRFVSAEDNYLPPDNFQEEPAKVLCHRTSPTNIGFALLANLSAYDFGYITLKQLLDRTQQTIETLLKLEKYKGHLYNWYDTQSLRPLHPRYVSTVDNGNLAAYLLTLRQGLLGLLNKPLLRIQSIEGLEDSFAVMKTTMPANPLINRFANQLKEGRLAFETWSTAKIYCDKLLQTAKQLVAEHNENEWAQQLQAQIEKLSDEINFFISLSSHLEKNVTLKDVAAHEIISLIDSLALHTYQLAQMDMSFLYNRTSRLMTIGFDVEKQLRDRGDYDLLSSEARLACFVAIALGEIPQDSWFALGRLQVMNKKGQALMMSWSGSMFEYLMPLLVMPSYPATLLDLVCKAAVNRHIAYGNQRNVPWGISESGYNAVDAHSNYLYKAFGVPELGLKRGLADDLVIAPYATVMALMVAPKDAILNLQRLAGRGAIGSYGFYEAIDFTSSRLPGNKNSVMIRSFMAHHQGMSLLAYSYLLHDKPMQARFIADPLFQSTLLLLQERIPKLPSSYFRKPPLHSDHLSDHDEVSNRIFNTPDTRTPQIQMLSNGRYHVMVTQAGSGYSRWKDIAVTRWREDGISDNRGLFTYICEIETNQYGSLIYQPIVDSVKYFKAIFSEAHVEFNRSEANLDIFSEIAVSPEDDVELRRFRIHNKSKLKRSFEFTSYAEVVLASQNDDQAQPAFSNLFVETEILENERAILATRRSRDQQTSPWMFHMINVYRKQLTQCSFETDRNQFVGRGRTPANPAAMLQGGSLSNTAGTVLDPIVSIRFRLTIEAGAAVAFDLFNGVADSRQNCLTLIEKYHDRHWANRIIELSWIHSQVLLHQLNITESAAKLYAKLAGSIIYAGNSFRADSQILLSNRNGQSKLWGYSISGDLPIVLVQIESAANIELVHQAVQAQAYWRRKGLIVDLVILNEESTSYRQSLQEQIMSLINTMAATEHAGGIYVRVAEQMPQEDRILLQSVARVILSDRHGSLKEQVNRRHLVPIAMKALTINQNISRKNTEQISLPAQLQFYNDFGGFNEEGNEYCIYFSADQPTPAPWINILANPNFGSLISESGQASSWVDNSHEFRLTPWNNDPIEDSSGEAYYLRDDETGEYWSPTALPCPSKGKYLTRHGFGYSVFEHREQGIYSEMIVYVALNAPIKFAVLTIRNESSQARQISAYGYVEWVLGDLRSKNAMHVTSEAAPGCAILANNYYNTDFGRRTAFFSAHTSRIGLNGHFLSASRAEFIGRNHTYANPIALTLTRLSGRVGAGLDPCAALQFSFGLERGKSREIIFILGAGQDREDALKLLNEYQDRNKVEQELQATKNFWRDTLGRIQINTPDKALNYLANGWLLYQTISSRMFARNAYYQSSGAFGFRDQLQDAMALVHSRPELYRAQLLLCASRQFIEGDVQHWWHPPNGRGVRTRCSDDYLWLPFALCHYIDATNDRAILDEEVAFLQGRPLKPDEESYYDLPTVSDEKASLYQHAVKSILHGMRYGVHQLPLMGSCDWNDGMNLVGAKGRGESVWLGFFLYSILKKYAELARLYKDDNFAIRCDNEAIQLKNHLEINGWDSEWYKRAYFDDGSPLGSVANRECKIDSIAQSWAVLSKAADPERAKLAMTSLHRYLVRPDDGVVALLDPPFHDSTPNPGYIQSYVRGIRENGGQYTHAATWVGIAFAEMNDNEKAWQVFNIINPIHHGSTRTEIDIYKIEPYVVAGDVYSVAPHIGRGGWSWYTGSAGWMYRLITESLLGIVLEEGRRLRFNPHFPADWDCFSVDYCYKERVYKITVSKEGEGFSVRVDGSRVEGGVFELE